MLRWPLEFITMSRMGDKTVKTGVFSGQIASSNLSEAQEKALELIKKDVQLEEMKGVVQEYLKTIEQLRHSLKHEKAKVAELEVKDAERAELEIRVKERVAELEVKDVERAALEVRVKELTEVLSKISGMVAVEKMK